MRTIDLVELIIILISIFLTVYIAFVKSYFTERGKIVATTKDIDLVTEKVEKIKNEFIRENEVLKANLQLLNQGKISLNGDKRKAILCLHEKLSLWISTIMNFNFGHSDSNAVSEIEMEKIEVKKNHSDFDSAVARYSLLFKETTEEINDRHFILLALIEMEKITMEHSIDYLSQLNICEMLKAKPNFNLEEYQKQSFKKVDIFESHRQKTLEKYKSIVKEYHSYTSFLREKLTQLYN